MIVEGYGRKRYKADFIKYLVYSHAECDETILRLEFLFLTESILDKNVLSSSLGHPKAFEHHDN